MRVVISGICALYLGLIAGGVWAAESDAIVGVWLTENGKARVRIEKQNGYYEGRIVALKEPDYPAGDPGGMAGQPKVDRKNPNMKLRGRRIVGVPLVSGFRYAGDGVWDHGHIYDPENGKTYSCKMTLTRAGVLRVRGYVGFSLFGRTTLWTRYRGKAGPHKPTPADRQ